MAARGNTTTAPSLKVVGTYLVVSVSWIALSDQLVTRLASGRDQLTFLQTVKGWAFVGLSALGLYVLVSRALRSAADAASDILQREAQIDLVLGQIPANIWTTDERLRITSLRGRGVLGPLRGTRTQPLEASQVVGTTVYERFGTEDPAAPPVGAHLRALEGHETEYTVDWEGRTSGSVVTPLRDPEGNSIGCLGFSIDVTDQVEIERERLRSLSRLERANTRAGRLLQHLVRAEGEERKRIAVGIHDDSIQAMTSAGMALDLLVARLPASSDADLARRARDLVRDSMRRLRSLVFELRPMELDRSGLAPSILLLLQQTAAESRVRFDFSDETSAPLDPDVAFLVYRIVQEALANVRKHARATLVTVTLSEADGGILTVVKDDGVGFDSSGDLPPDHFGLRDMSERAEIAEGWCRIESTPSEGTVVEAWVPRAVAVTEEVGRVRS
ncbi:MAG TPA: histidine kinase [Actinomycetota bacterium]|nr:histidine kinase [Actinomycetota bacterium]